MAEIIKAKELNKRALKKIIEKLRKGSTIIYPTETCYGIGCSIKSKKAIERIYSIKGRKKGKPFPILFAAMKNAGKIAVITREAEKLAGRFMPGPLNLIVEKKGSKGSTICFRIPGNKIAFALAKGLNEGLISTSCNKSGEKEAYSARKAIKEFSGKVDIIIDAGPLPKRKPSTVYDIKAGKALREGKIKERKIIKVLKAKK
ncbi:MAG: L-threonylcarbamoyladenylate synthase [Candidatus Diapherotrites archaeon]